VACFVLGKSVSNEYQERSQHISPATLALLLLIGAVGAGYYLTYLLNPANRGDLIPYLLVLLAESTIIFQAFMAYWTILAGSYNPKDFQYVAARQKLFGTGKKVLTPASKLYLRDAQTSVDVYITVYGEPIETVEQTATAARDLIGKHETYILDDGESDTVKAMAERIGVGYIRRKQHKHAKAGNINHALGVTNGEFFVVFDADHTPKPNFLQETMPFFASPKTAFVQTPQFYNNTHNPIARGAAFAQQLFYRFICTGKNRFNAVFCVGTNVVFRRSAIEEVGGIYEKSNSEDIWTSILLHEAGYVSIFIPDVLAEGQAPDTIAAYTKQQLRWATGGFEILFTHNPLRAPKMSLDQKMQYFSTVTFYLLGVAVALLFLVPPMAIFMDMTAVNASGSLFDWLLHYLAFYGFYFGVTIYCMSGFKFETLVLASASFPTYIKALWNVITSKAVGWTATGKRVSEKPLNYLVPQILVFLFLLASTIFGVILVLGGKPMSLALVWNAFNTFIFGYYINMSFRSRASEPAPGKPEEVTTTKQATEGAV
jgi:cellulose synthase (UDP-forming)